MNSDQVYNAINAGSEMNRLPALRVAILAAFLGGSLPAAPADEAADRDAIAAPSETADPASAPKSAEETELAEIDREIGEGIRSLRARETARETTARERLAEWEAFLLLNRELLARRDALAKQVTAAARAKPVFHPPLPPREPVPGESREEAVIREFDAVFDAGVEAIRAAESDPAALLARLRDHHEANAEALAARDALRARLVVPPDPALVPVPEPRAARPGESPREAELRGIENLIESALAAHRAAVAADPSGGGNLHATFLEANRALLDRRDILIKEVTKATLDTPDIPNPLSPAP